MIKYQLQSPALAVMLALLTGYVDALGFINLGGFFLSFMSGNLTHLGVDAVRNIGHAWVSAAIIATFVLGAFIGTLAAHHGFRNRSCTVLLLSALLLAVAAAAHAMASPALAITTTTLAMGAINCIFVSNRDEVTTGVGYMTGTLVKLGQDLAHNLISEEKVVVGSHFRLWIGFVGGVMLGAAIHPSLGLHALWLAAGAALVLAAIEGRTTAPA
jgi:uncharacterized membrane protein YoaK (UPF0700 family)